MRAITRLLLPAALTVLACGAERSGDYSSEGLDTSSGQIEKIAADEGSLIGSFTSRKTAAFDDEESQTVEESAWTAIYDAAETEIIIGKEWRRPMLVSRVEVFEPSDGAFFSDAQNYPEGGAGRVHLLGQMAGETVWTVVASQSFSASNGSAPVVIDAKRAGLNKPFVKHAVGFTTDDGLAGLVRVAEVVFYGAVSGLPSVIDWETTEFACTGLTCVEYENTNGVEKRTVRCLRDGEHPASEALCPEPKPDTDGDSCSLSCPYELVFIGYRAFSYADGSGWLHEGRFDSRAGPMPSSTSSGTTVDAIEGKPCSILTENPKTYFVGISCKEEPNDPNYCAFQCR